MKRANMNKPERWKEDIRKSVDHYNAWFLSCAPPAFRDQREKTASDVEHMFDATDDLRTLRPEVLVDHPQLVKTLRMATCPPIARDRLSGLADLPTSVLNNMEKKKRLPPRADEEELNAQLVRICAVINKLVDKDLHPWLEEERTPDTSERRRAAVVVADRLTGAIANPIIRNAQEARQFDVLEQYLECSGYTEAVERPGTDVSNMPNGTYAFHVNVTGETADGTDVNIPVDVVIMPMDAEPEELPVLVEAKSAGDFTNVNKRRKEEAVKAQQLRARHGEDVRIALFLCGYFDSTYLGYEAAEGLDWVWEHRVADFSEIGV